MIVTVKELLDYLTTRAKCYHAQGIEASVRRNEHMHNFGGYFDRALADAVLTDFLNFVGADQGVDLGLYASELEKKEGNT